MILKFALALVIGGTCLGASYAQEHSADEIRRAIQEAREAAERARSEGRGLGLTRGGQFGPMREVLVTNDGVNAGPGSVVTYAGGSIVPVQTNSAGEPDPETTTSWVFVEEFGEIQFEHDSVAITPGSVPTVAALGDALGSQSFAEGRIMMMGHSDASGDEDYNFALSVRRARALGAYLASDYGVDPRLLVTSGAGEWALKNTADPYAAENRRVEIYLEAAG